MTEQKKSASLKEDILFLVLKLLIFLVLIAVMIFFVFGIYRCSDNMMSPAFKDGDLAIYYRLQKEFQPSDTVIIEKDGETQIRRIIAKPGDSVEITADGLKINGYLQQETGIYTETLPYTEGISFPITLEENEYFVLGDNRSEAKDSRIYGAVKKEKIKGTVITLLRHRGF
ncbi:MAG: signal peptidase I [Lachnospiraceae bacterium]|nr:signal peptidase I [Clostridiales bacterium]MBS5131252.1 signal peptidase I [Lachnospiraceae bacterium]